MTFPVNDPDGPNERKQQEKRQHPRIKVAVPTEIHVEGASGPLSVKTADLSMGGLYVEMMFTLALGTKLKTVLWVNDVEVSTDGIVVTRDIQVGNGIKFTNMTPENRERLKNFLSAEAAKHR
jgi:c-di-GMP-binding flagellar brake protein YcgR